MIALARPSALGTGRQGRSGFAFSSTFPRIAETDRSACRFCHFSFDVHIGRGFATGGIGP